MGIEFERHEKRAEKARLNRASCMNNSKWQKLFKAIEDNGKCNFQAKLKVLASDKTYPFTTNPGIHESGSCTKDSGIQGPIAFKDIEWICVCALHEIKRHNRNEKLDPYFVKQDILALKEIMDKLAKFEYDYDENSLKIYGYR